MREGDDDRPVHASHSEPPGGHRPPARRPRDGRHVGGDPVSRHPRGGSAALARCGALRQEARGRRGLCFHWGPTATSVQAATEEFDAASDSPNQVESKPRDEVVVSAEQLLDIRATPGEITEEGLRLNVNVGIQYISSWLRGNGAAAIYGLMEGIAATAEISRSQVWQWIRHAHSLTKGPPSPPSSCRSTPPASWRRSARRRATPSGSSARGGRGSRASCSRRWRCPGRPVRGVPDAAGVRAAGGPPL